MSATTVGAPTASTTAVSTRLRTDPAFQAFTLLRIGFTVAPILFGIDKFANVMVDWSVYLAPWINDILPGSADQAMYVIGVVEIIAGLAVALRPRYGALIVAAWLGRDHLQPAHLLGLLRHRAAGLRPHARCADAGAPGHGVRPLSDGAAAAIAPGRTRWPRSVRATRKLKAMTRSCRAHST